MNEQELKQIVEAVLFAASEPLNISQLLSLLGEDAGPGRDAVLEAIQQIQQDYEQRSVELKETGSGYRFQVKQNYAQWVTRLWEEKPARYSRATLETVALIAYRQPITRAEIEEVRGVSVSSSIIKSLQERNWVKVVGYRDVPGKPALYATTRGFLDYFNLSSLEDLPSLAELRDIDAINAELDLEPPQGSGTAEIDTEAGTDVAEEPGIEADGESQDSDEAQPDGIAEAEISDREVQAESAVEESIAEESIAEESIAEESVAEESIAAEHGGELHQEKDIADVQAALSAEH